MKSLFRIQTKSPTADGKSLLWVVLLASGLLLVGKGLAATSTSPPHLKPAQEILMGILPKSCGDLLPDEDGNLWCSDLLRKSIVKITPSGKEPEILEGAKLFPGGLEFPGRLSLSGSLLAVEDHNMSLHIVNVKTRRHVQTIPYEVLHGEVRINPSAGFTLWNDRILYTGLGFQGAPPSFDQPAQALTLFSTDLDGRGLDILKQENLPAAARIGRTLFGTGFSAPVPHGRMAVCQALPGRLLLLGPGGKVLRETPVRGLDVPAISREVLAHEDLQAETLAATPHIAGIFVVKDWIALVIERPSPAGPRLTASWLTLDLDPVKEEVIELPAQLSKWDVVARIICDRQEGVLFLVRRQQPGTVPSARLFRSQVIW